MVGVKLDRCQAGTRAGHMISVYMMFAPQNPEPEPVTATVAS